jgi:hypothetical protein
LRIVGVTEISVSQWWQIRPKRAVEMSQTFNIIPIFLCFRLSYHNLEHLINFAESFTWKQFPTRDPETGILTMRGHITRIGGFTIFAWAFVGVFHVMQTSYRILSSHAMMYPTWYPFDVSTSPLYEIVNFTQVGLRLYRIQKGHRRNIRLYSAKLTKYWWLFNLL